MEKKVLNEAEQKIINEVKDKELKEMLTEGFINGEFMTSDEFCQKLETLKASLIKKHQMLYGESNCL